MKVILIDMRYLDLLPFIILLLKFGQYKSPFPLRMQLFKDVTQKKISTNKVTHLPIEEPTTYSHIGNRKNSKLT